MFENKDFYKNKKKSEGFIRRYADRLNWQYLCYYQAIPEPLIEEFSDRVEWLYIGGKQQLTDDFIRKHACKLNWYNLSINQNFFL